jgi:hypothetical protein
VVGVTELSENVNTSWAGLGEPPGARFFNPGLDLVMLSAVPDELTPQPFNRFDQIDSLHDTTSTSRRRIPGIVPLVTS